jgi:Ca-activated chloride channel family protein
MSARRNPEFEPREDHRHAGVALFILGATTLVTTIALVRFDPLDIVGPRTEIYYDDLPDRYATLLLEEPAEATEASNPDAGEGARAKREEGAVGKQDATPVTREEKVANAQAKEQARREAVSKSMRLQMLIGTRGETQPGTVPMDVFADGDANLRSLDEALRMVDGASAAGLDNVQMRGQKMGIQGQGLGGGGSAAGIGGLGTRGRGSGASGYGSGSGSFSAHGGIGVRGQGHGGLAPAAADASVGAEPEGLPVAGPLFAPVDAYDDLGDDSLTDPRVDPWSTFAADVDTASWSYTRRSLREGRLPAPDRVRVEEFVNAFHYDYVHPTTDAPFAVNMEAAPDPLRPGHTVLRVGVQGANPEAERPPARLTFLVDVSGSMRGRDRLALAQDSLLWLVDHLGPEDSVALVTYAGSTRVVLEPTPAWQRQTIRNAIQNLRSGGGTSMGAGMQLAYELADRSYVEGAENRVVVLSDGDANIGATSPEAMLAKVKAHAEGGITMSTLGFGMGNYRDDMMEKLADKGDGMYAYVDSREEARRVFGERLGGTLQTIAKDVKIQMEFDPDAVVGWRLVGYENRAIADKDFRNDKVDAGEIGADHQVTAIYDVVLRDRLPAAQPIAKVNLRAKPPGPDRPAEEWTTTFPAGLMRAGWPAASRDLRAAWTLAQTADKLRGEPLAADVPWKRLAAEAAELDDQGFPRAAEIRTQIEQAEELSAGLAHR